MAKVRGNSLGLQERATRKGRNYNRLRDTVKNRAWLAFVRGENYVRCGNKT